MLIGEYHHNLDDKNRLTMPSKLLSELGDTVIVARGFDPCLMVYPLEKWNNLISKFSVLPITKEETRKFMRIFLSSATSCKFDNQNRICIPSILLNYAGISKETAILGIDDHAEIWDKSAYDNFLVDNLSTFTEIAEKIDQIEV